MYTSHLWSLSVEENFYLFWPIVFMSRGKTRKVVAWTLVITVPFLRIIIDQHPVKWISEQSVFIRIDSIALGCLCALYKGEILAKINTRWYKLFYTSLICLFALPWLALFVEKTYFRLVFVALGVLTGTLGNFLIANIMLFSVYGPKGKWHQILNSKIFDFIGVLSYSLYLWQQIFIFNRFWWVAQWPQNIVLIFSAALFSRYIIERPFLQLKDQFARDRMSHYENS